MKNSIFFSNDYIALLFFMLRCHFNKTGYAISMDFFSFGGYKIYIYFDNLQEQARREREELDKMLEENRRRVEEAQRREALEFQRKEEERYRELELIQRQKEEAARRKKLEEEEERENQTMLSNKNKSRPKMPYGIGL